MKMLDSNILIRYLTNDHPKLASRCEALFKRVAEGKEKIFLNHLVVAEVVWVLKGHYHFPKDLIAEIFLRLLNTPNIEIPEKDILISTFSIWQLTEFNVDFIEVYNEAYIVVKKFEGIYSYDTDFDKLNIPRFEP